MKESDAMMTCGCCEGTEAVTPLPIANRPGLDALRYRVGSYGSFLETMQARLSTLCLGTPDACAAEEAPFPLRSLTTRAADDAAIALLHGWATVGDVLTFYQERIANEGYLRTATERLSILELARLVGYRLRPGVSASVFLAFTLQDGYEVQIPSGTRAQSLPAPGELPQPFETAEPLAARAVWNAIRPRQMQPQKITYEYGYSEADPDTVSPYDARRLEWIDFAGIETGLEANDPLLFLFGSNPTPDVYPVVRRVVAVEPQRAADRTRVSLYIPPLPDVAPVEAVAEAIFETAARYRRVEDFDVSRERVMTRNVLAELDALTATVSPQMTGKALVEALDKHLVVLRQEHEAAVEGGYSLLEPWVGALVRDLSHIRQESALRVRRERRLAAVRAASGHLSAASVATRALSEESILPPALQVLDGYLGSLAQPPSIPPPNLWQRPQNLAQTLGAGGDIAPKLLVNLAPELKRHTYAFWSGVSTPATTFTQPDAVAAMRGQAAPFGHNAPLKPILDDDGLIIGHEEWPLVGLTAGLRLSHQTGGDTLGEHHFNTPLSIAFSMKHGAIRDVVMATLDSDSADPLTRTVLGIDVTLTPQFEGGINGNGGLAEISYELLGQRIDISVDDGELILSIAGTNINLVIAPGESKRAHDPGTGYITRASLSHDGQVSITVDMLGARLQGELREILEHEISLDTTYEDIAPGSWVIVERADTGVQVVRQVRAVRTASLAAYGITGKVTHLSLQRDTSDHWLEDGDDTIAAYRNTTIHGASEALTLAEIPVEEVVQQQVMGDACRGQPVSGDVSDLARRFLKPVRGSELLLDGLYDGLEAGRWAIVKGERLDLPGVVDAELVMLSSVEQYLDPDLPGDTTHTRLLLSEPLAYCYLRDTVTVYGNVVKATHGETREEVLGSGDGSQAWQTFALKHSPLTFLAAPTPQGAASTLEVRANSVLWREVDNLFIPGPDDRVYMVSTDDDDVTTVRFGDGRHGARLPTGGENVRAVYRSASGKIGNVPAGQISLLSARPLGVKSVVNPLPATGGADRENRDTARQNAPLGVMALDRLVSVQDYADFARTFAGIGKARAARLSDGRRRLVHVTIAGADDVPIALTSDLYHMLVRALHDYGDPYQPLQVALRDLKLLFIAARVRVHADYEWETVGPWVQQALLDTFSFSRRLLGQDVYRSEVLTAIQAVRGVAFVDVDALGAIAESEVTSDFEALVLKLDEIVAQSRASADKVVQWVAAEMAHIDRSGQIRPAQLVYLNPDVPETLILEEIS